MQNGVIDERLPNEEDSQHRGLPADIRDKDMRDGDGGGATKTLRLQRSRTGQFPSVLGRGRFKLCPVLPYQDKRRPKPPEPAKTSPVLVRSWSASYAEGGRAHPFINQVSGHRTRRLWRPSQLIPSCILVYRRNEQLLKFRCVLVLAVEKEARPSPKKPLAEKTNANECMHACMPFRGA